MRDTSGKFTTQKNDKFEVPLHLAIQSAFIDLEEVISGNRDISVPFIVGAPGGGKTSIIRAECQKRGWNLYARNTGMMVNEELSGIPELIHEKGKKGERDYPTCLWSKPQLISDVEHLAESAPTVIFFDDWHRTNSVIQSLAFETFTDYTLKGFPLPKNVAFILAGNDSVAAGARDQLSAVLNRTSKKYVKTDYDQWKRDFGFDNAHPFVLGFLDAAPNRKFFHMEESMYEPWASPRSWSYLSKKIFLMEKAKIEQDDVTRMAEFSSYVGQAAAAELLKYDMFYRNINVEKIFKTGKYKIPSSTVERYIFTSVVNNYYVAYWEGEGEDKSEEKANIYISILEDLCAAQKEMGAICLTMLRDKRPMICSTLAQYGLLKRTLTTELYNYFKDVNQILS